MSEVPNIQIVKTIGTGLQATITLCDHPHDGSQFVIKECRLLKYSLNETAVLNRFRGSPHAVQLLDIEMPTHFFGRAVPLRFYENGDLFNLLSALHDQELMNEKLSKSIFKQIMLGVAELHAHQIAHRDLKPENFFVDENFKIVIGDFGLSNVQGESKCDNCAIEDICGTIGYMSPEILESTVTGAAYNAYHADMWSTGCLLFMTVTGNMPFGEKGACAKDWYFVQIKTGNWEAFWNLHQRGCPLEISPVVRRIIESLFSVDPTLRPSATELLENAWFKDDSVYSEDAYLEIMEQISLPSR
jgi:serine/threonine protein kinase